jgi:E1A/CREB-binding protein
MQRIKRNAIYFTDRTKQNHWCSTCFDQLDPNELILLDDGSKAQKKELQEFKNDALPEEGWVNCDICHSWVHQICALFNGRTNKSDAQFCCPTCYLNQNADDGNRKRNDNPAEDLARCKMSDVIEKGLEDALQAAYAARAAELGVDVDVVEKADQLSVRVVSNVDKQHFVGDKVRYAGVLMAFIRF